MTTKEYLQQGYRLARGIRFKRERIRELREFAQRSAAVCTTERIGGRAQHSKLENCICQMDEWEREIDEAMRELQKIHQVIASVKNLDYRQLLELRYLHGLSWVDVSIKMGYAERHMYRMHNNALKDVSECQ